MSGAATMTTGSTAAQERKYARSQCEINVPSATNCMLAIADATAHVTPACIAPNAKWLYSFGIFHILYLPISSYPRRHLTARNTVPAGAVRGCSRAAREDSAPGSGASGPD